MAPAARMRATTVASCFGMLLELPQPGGRDNAGRVEDVFDREGHAVQRAELAPPRVVAVGGTSLDQRSVPSVRTTAFRCGFIAPICSMCALTISSDEMLPGPDRLRHPRGRGSDYVSSAASVGLATSDAMSPGLMSSTSIPVADQLLQG